MITNVLLVLGPRAFIMWRSRDRKVMWTKYTTADYQKTLFYYKFRAISLVIYAILELSLLQSMYFGYRE